MIIVVILRELYTYISSAFIGSPAITEAIDDLTTHTHDKTVLIS